jgi:Flp pilus assembly pilin Flp
LRPRSAKLMRGSRVPESITRWKGAAHSHMTLSLVMRRLKGLPSRQRSEEGQALVEYSLLLSLAAFAALFSVQAFGLGVSGLYSTVVSVYP